MLAVSRPSPRFCLGKVFCTPGVAESLNRDLLMLYLLRHGAGDWGDLCSQDRRSNEVALKKGGRLFSAYQIETDTLSTKLWIITEADRSSTTLLFPHEY